MSWFYSCYWKEQDPEQSAHQRLSHWSEKKWITKNSYQIERGNCSCEIGGFIFRIDCSKYQRSGGFFAFRRGRKTSSGKMEGLCSLLFRLRDIQRGRNPFLLLIHFTSSFLSTYPNISSNGRIISSKTWTTSTTRRLSSASRKPVNWNTKEYLLQKMKCNTIK